MEGSLCVCLRYRNICCGCWLMMRCGRGPKTGNLSSVSPSISLSISPSISASVSPSASLSPSRSPSLSPSLSASISPSASLSPSLSPSISPSVSPSASLSPSLSPSISPSTSPSISLSISPSQSPSASLSPSISPSHSPSISPSVSPSASPSASLSPSISPSASPSEAAGPASGTVILGTESSATDRSTNNSFGTAGVLYHCSNVLFTASWTEAASSCVLNNLKAHYDGAGGATYYAKMAIYDGSTKDLIAITNALNVPAEGSASTKTFSFSSPPTITKGNTYILGFILDSGYLIACSTHPYTGAQISRNTGGTYASPPTNLTNNNTNHQSGYTLDLWGTA